MLRVGTDADFTVNTPIGACMQRLKCAKQDQESLGADIICGLENIPLYAKGAEPVAGKKPKVLRRR